MTPTNLPRLLLRAVLTALCCLTFVLVSLAAEAKKVFNVPAGPAAETLKQFQSQSGTQLLYAGEVIEGVRTNAAQGDLTPAEALNRMFGDTGLTVVKDKRDGSLTLRKETEVEKNGARLAQKNSDQPIVQKTEMADGTLKLPAFTVQGTKTINADIQRTRDDPQPYVTFDRAALEQSQAITLEDFFRKRLTMNTTQMSQSQVGLGVFTSVSQINLRGLGANQTLILVDGRRMPGQVSSDASQPDINGIPMSMVERIEVLPATASGIYGGGATGGVINIITRKDYAGADLRLTYGNTFDTDVGYRRVDFSAGFSAAKTHVRLAVSHSDSNGLLAGDRDFMARSRALQLANNPGVFFTPTTANTIPRGATSNIRNAAPNSNTNLVLKAGAALSSPITFVPLGYSGPASDGGAALVANAGRYNLDIPADEQAGLRSALIAPTIESASVNLRREFGERVEVFVDGTWQENVGHMEVTQFGTAVWSTTLAANAPNNPFTTPVIVSFPVTNLSRPGKSTIEKVRGVAGVIVRLPHDWTISAEYSWGRDRSSFRRTSTPVGDPDGTGSGISYATAVANGTLNVMRDLNAFPLDYSPYLLPSPNSIGGPYSTELRDASIRASGNLVELPGGALALSALAEHWQEEGLGGFQDDASLTNAFTGLFRPSRSQVVDSYYLELRAPLVSKANGRHWVQNLEIQASVRRDAYKTNSPSPSSFLGLTSHSPLPAFTTVTNQSTATKYTVAMKYSPVSGLSLRTSVGTGFLPPSVGQITPNEFAATTQQLSDPKRGSVLLPTSISARTGGNPTLTPEESKSWSVGAAFSPRHVPGLRISVDYIRIDKSNEIFPSPSTQFFLDSENSVTGRVERAPLTPADSALGYTGGPIISIDRTALNISTARIDAYDLQVDYEKKTNQRGDFHFYAVATWQPHFKRRITPDQPLLEFVDRNTGPLEWRGNAGLTWQRGAWAMDWNVQYFHSYLIWTPTANAAAIDAAVLSQGSTRVAGVLNHDAKVTYRFPISAAKGMFSGVEVSVGLQNVFDRMPPILASNGTNVVNSDYSYYADPRLRNYTLSLRKRF